jgi:hypothetical protein
MNVKMVFPDVAPCNLENNVSQEPTSSVVRFHHNDGGSMF